MTRKTTEKREVWAGQTEASRITGTPARTIRNWIDRGIIATNEKGEVCCLQVLRQDRDRQVEESDRQREKKGNPQQQLILAQTEKIKVETQIKRLELRKAEGGLISFDEVAQDFETALVTSRSKLLAIPTRMALDLAGTDNPKEIARKLTEVIDESLQSLADGWTNAQEKADEAALNMAEATAGQE
jgi:hypothetical protein